jgi:tRNA U34 5-methylaminomethyl-2-thiouridine-forming methyltransferase MnmC
VHRHIFYTEDGSHSIAIPEWKVTYHSRYGAIQESQHIFIEAGLKPLLEKKKEISIFEMGFGTGLNALLTLMVTNMFPVKIYYEAADNDPLELPIASSLNYTTVLQTPALYSLFMQMHQLPWNTMQQVSDKFYLHKRNTDISEIVLTETFDLIYFDAFDPVTQPGLWTTAIFRKLHDAMCEGGTLLTYCSKTVVRRSMQDAGFIVEKIAGPKGKREVVRAHAE